MAKFLKNQENISKNLIKKRNDNKKKLEEAEKYIICVIKINMITTYIISQTFVITRYYLIIFILNL